MANLSAVIVQLRQERGRAANQVRRLDQAISVLTSLNGSAGNTGSHLRKTLSAAARRRIAAAARARWAKLKSATSANSASGKTQASAAKKAPRRVLSAAARGKIAAAARARWAKVRAQQQNRKKAA